MTEVFSFAQRPRLCATRRGRIVGTSTNILTIALAEGGERAFAVPSHCREYWEHIEAIVARGADVAWIEAEYFDTVLQLFLMVDEAGVEGALASGGWSVEHSLILLARSVWREARVPADPFTEGATHDGTPTATVSGWRAEHRLFGHQRRSVAWMRYIESQIPLTITYDGNLRVTPRWYIDTENERFCEDPSPREAQLLGGLCADGTGLGKTASTLRLIAETRGGGPSLVVLGLNLVAQWRAEIDKFLDTDVVRVLFITTGKEYKPLRQEQMQATDLIVTTFHFLRYNKTYAEHTEALLHSKARERALLTAWARSAPPSTPCILEAVPWRRIVVDEIHQTFERTGDMRALRLFRPVCLWGLSATPTLHDVHAQHLYIFLAREKAHHPNLLASVVRIGVRRGVSAEMASAATTDRDLRLTSLSAEERIRLEPYDQTPPSHQIQEMTFLSARRKNDDMDEQVRLEQSRALDTLVLRLRFHDRSIRILDMTTRTLTEERERGEPDESGELRAAFESHLEDVAAAQAIRDRLQEQIERLRASQERVDALQTRGASCQSCDGQQGLLLSAPCDHLFCNVCLQVPSVVCPVCGGEISDVVHVGGAHGVGTKMKSIANLIASFEIDTPILLFVQWKSMLRGMLAFLRSRGFVCHRLEGSASQRAATLRALLRDGGVLLLCLEDGFAGLHLPFVSKVIFAHALVGDADRVDMLERQAVARCQRFGQTQQVQTFSFVVADTVESEIYYRTHA